MTFPKISPRTAALANLNHWRKGQGAKIADNRPPQVFEACEFIAERIAHIRDPLILKADEIATAIHRAISQERCRKFGPLSPTLKADEWWSQIAAIAHSWNIETTRADWESTTKSEVRDAA